MSSSRRAPLARDIVAIDGSIEGHQGRTYCLMPTIFRADCTSCGYQSDVFPAGYGAIFVDEPPATEQPFVAGMASLDGSRSHIAWASFPNLIVLAHPAEATILKDAGHTYASLLREGRYVRVDRVVCRPCGTIYDHCKLTAPGEFGCVLGCVLPCFIGLVAGLLFTLQRAEVLGLTPLLSGAAVVVALVALGPYLYTALWFRARSQELARSRACPSCESTEMVSVATKGTFPCPKCNERALRICNVGIS